jgi:hypothetical protein
MSAVEQLYNQAARCFRLAEGVAGLRLVDELEALGRMFEREALELETSQLQFYVDSDNLQRKAD